MPKTHIALIVGAGLSCEAALPSTERLAEQFLESPSDGVVAVEVEQEISKHLMKFWQQIFGYVDGKSRPSLEDHFTAIDLAANTGHHLGPSYSPRKLRAIRRFSIHRAFQILDLKYRQSETIGSLLAELWKGAGFSIVSLNWDVVVENHFHALQQAYDYGAIVEPLSSAADLRKSGTPICKLHGSANWVYCDSCRTLFSGLPGAGKDALHLGAFLESDDFELFGSRKEIVELVRGSANIRRLCRICGCPLTARVGTFSYRKDYAIQQFQAIWYKALDALRKSPVWLFVGYSMPEADFEFRQVLKSAELASRRKSPRHIQVVLKDDDRAAERYRRFFGLNASSINQDGLKQWMATSFKDWLGSVEKPT